MTSEHRMTWDPVSTESVGEDGWVVTKLTGVTKVRCSCGLAETVPNGEVRRFVEEHPPTST
jgi:hypothetical protein